MQEQPDDKSASTRGARPGGGFLQIASAVFWGFFGVRKRRSFEQDVTAIKPHHIVIAGIIGGALFVLLLLVVVRLIVASAAQ